MAAIFPTRPGQVVAVEDSTLPANAEPAISLEPSFAFSVTRSIIQRVTIAQQANYQFLHTLGQQIFIYSFGDRIGQIGIQGLAFGISCPGQDGGGDDLGIERVLDYYNENKLSRREETVKLTLGQSQTFEGFITSVTSDIVNTEAALFSFNLNLALVPEAP